MTERISSGIRGLDWLIEGGIPQGFNVIISGAPGTGKTIFGLQFIHEGVKNQEPGCYVSFEQFKEELIEQAQQFGWDDIKNERLFSLLAIRKKNIQSFINYLKDEVEAKKIKRLVIDSLSVLSVYTNIMEDPDQVGMDNISADIHSRTPTDLQQLRDQTIYHLMAKIKELGCTTLLIGEQIRPDKPTRDEVSEFVADGLILLKRVQMGNDVIRSISIEKMRETNANTGKHTMEFSNTGIIVKSKT